MTTSTRVCDSGTKSMRWKIACSSEGAMAKPTWCETSNSTCEAVDSTWSKSGASPACSRIRAWTLDWSRVVRRASSSMLT